MNHRMPPPYIWVAQFIRGDFSICDAPRPEWPKTVTTPEIIDQIHELILEDSRISAKSIAEQLGISRERVGSIIREDLDMGKLSAKWVPKCLNADQKRQRCQSSEQLWEFFSARSKRCPVAIGDHGRNLVISLWPGHKATINGVAAQRLIPPRKNSECKNPLEKFSPRFFWDQDGILLIDYLPKGQTNNAEYYLSLLVQLKDILKEKRRGKVTKVVLFLHDNAPAHRTLATQKNWPTWASSGLITHPILWIWPRRTSTCSLDWKNNWKVTIFRPTRRSLLPRRPGCTDNLLNFFLSGLQKLEPRAKKCIGIFGEYVE